MLQKKPCGCSSRIAIKAGNVCETEELRRSLRLMKTALTQTRLTIKPPRDQRRFSHTLLSGDSEPGREEERPVHVLSRSSNDRRSSFP